MRYFSIFVFALAFLVGGCASVDLKRAIHDTNGKLVGHVEVKHNMTTADGASQLIDSARKLEESTGNVAERTVGVAEKAVDKGMPTSVTTKSGNVSAGGHGYGLGYGQGMYSHQYGAMFYGEQMTFAGHGHGLPRLDVNSHGGGLQDVGRVPCPVDRSPATPGERIACLEKGQQVIGQKVFEK